VPFSQQHADAACNFFELVLKHSADEWWGKPFVLAPWQEEVLQHVFGNLDDEGNRVIEQVYLEVPKKAGKTEFAAGLVLWVSLCTSAPGCQVYGAAAATRQAMDVYRAACKMVEQSPLLQKQFRILRGTNRILKRSDPDSFYAAIAADGDLGDGVNPAFVVADEVHRWKTRKQQENWDVLSKGGITRRQTLTVAITTAGVQSESPLAWRLHEKTRKIQEGIVSDARFFGRLYGAEKTDDPGDPKTWIKANPSLIENGGFLPLAKIGKEYASALSEGTLTAFKRYFLNIWDQQEDRAIDMVHWDACPTDWIAAPLRSKLPEDKVRRLPEGLLKRFIERRCWAGVDLSMTTDLSAVAFVFQIDGYGPALEPQVHYEVLPFFWMPKEAVTKLQCKDGMPYERWVEEGWIETCPGACIDYRDVEERLKWGAEMFDVEQFCWDPYNSHQISVPMIEAGYQCMDVKQGLVTLHEPTKKILELIAQHRLHHGNHPVLRFNASCASLVRKNDLIMFKKPDREKESSRMDGISATVDALTRAILFEHQPKYRKSIFDSGTVVL
jgi:phage terminase large subunit-like protein